jgi:translocation and assembly module TamB
VSEPVPEPSVPPPRPRRVSGRSAAGKLLRVVLSLFVLLAILAGLGWTLLHNAGMTSRVIPLLPGVKVIGGTGALLGDFKATRVDIALPRGGYIILQDVTWTGLQVWPDAGVSWRLGVQAQTLSAKRVEFDWVSGLPGPASGPLSDLDLPLSVRIGRVQVAEAYSRYWGAAPLTQIDAGLALQVPKGLIGREHEVKVASVTWQGWQAAGEGRAGTGGKMPIDAMLTLAGSPDAKDPAKRVKADLRAKGPLAHLQVKGQTVLSRQGEDGAVLTKGQLDVEGEVTPLAGWPLSQLKARATGFDLAGLYPGLPVTSLSGDVLIEPVAKQDLQAKLALKNSMAGAWDAGRLPLRELQGRISLLDARLAPTLAATLNDGMVDLLAQLPAVGKNAQGSLALKGGWGATRTLRADWRGLMPHALHTAAPPLQLNGNLLLKPQWRAGLSELAQTEVEVSMQAQGLYGRAFATEAVPARSALPQMPLPVNMNLSAKYGPGRVFVRQWRLQAQEAQAELRESLLQWGGPMPWQVKAHATVQAFDPKVWLPWPSAVTGANRISGKVDADLNADWRGLVRADIAPSTLGGVPLQGKVSWQSPQNRQLMNLLLDLDMGGNTAAIKADLPWQRDAQGELRWSDSAAWQGRIHATALQNLQAIAPLVGAVRIAGAVEAEGSAKGLWPKLSTQGHANVSRFQWDMRSGKAIRLESAKADWQLDTGAVDAPVRVRVELAKGQAANATLEQAVLSLDGSWKDHRASLVGDLAQQMPKQRKPTAIHVEMSAQGAMRADVQTAMLSAWDGRVAQLMLRTGGLAPRVLLYAQPFRLQAAWSGEGRHLIMSPTSINVMGVALDVRRLDWRTASTLDDPIGELHVDGELNPLNLSTVLASWQPQAGWGGDLQVTGKVAVHHSQAEAWRVDAEVMRQSGDLSLSEPTIEGNVVQRLGIRQASVTLHARNGAWVVNEQFDGRLFGVFTGRQTVTVADARSLPSATDPLAGEINMQIRNLRPWGTWLPAGWRLGGQMSAQAKLGGTLGVPQYAGTVNGEGLALGQALLGVNMTDGVLQMKLEGDHLYLTRFEARSGSQGGSMTATGEVLLTETPELRLSVKADRFGLLQRVDRRVVISGEASGVAGTDEIKVDGSLLVDEGLIDISRSDAPTVGEDVYVVNLPGDDDEEDEDDAGAGASQRKLNANIDVDLGQKLKLRGRGLEAFLTGKLKVSTPANRPSIRGAIKLENGTYAAYGQKLVIERGSVAFTGAIENPRLDILAMRAESPTAASTDVKVGVNITGTAQDPRVRLYSDPAMSETEKLSWLVLGRAPTGLGGADIGLLQSAAVALLSGEKSSPSDNLVGRLGLDELSVRQTDGAVRETVVNLGKQVSKYWYVGYERNLNETSGNWQLIYRLAQRFTVRAQAGDDNAIDFIRSWRWD